QAITDWTTPYSSKYTPPVLILEMFNKCLSLGLLRKDQNYSKFDPSSSLIPSMWKLLEKLMTQRLIVQSLALISDSRVQRDNDDCRKMVEWFKHYNPFPETSNLISLSTGFAGDSRINCHMVKEEGILGIKRVEGSF
ncbi:hypothetical protein AVEN_93160-1, partial [Araneus ventricosus]